MDADRTNTLLPICLAAPQVIYWAPDSLACQMSFVLPDGGYDPWSALSCDRFC